MKSVKPLLFICGGLMATATLIGAIDYSQASKSGKLKDLYKDEPLASHVVPVVNKELDIDKYSRAPIDRKEVYPTPTDEVVTSVVYNEKKPAVKRKIIKRKNVDRAYSSASDRIELSAFSRAPIRRIKREEKVVAVAVDSAVVVSQ